MDDLDKANARIAELEAENKALNDSNTKLNVDLTDTKTRLQERSGEFKHLRDLTEKEKGELSAKELEIMKNQELLNDKAAKLEADQKAFQDAQRNSMIDRYINEHAHGNKDLADKIRFNFDKKLGSIEAGDEQSIAQKVKDSVALVKDVEPDLITSAINSGGRADESSVGAGFSDTDAGKSLAKSLGLPLGEATK
jgi:chromosome segregation ATPase